MSKQKVTPGVTKERWNEIKALKINEPKMIHESCWATMIDNPLGSAYPKIPYVQKPGVTRDLGIRKAKIAKREQEKLERSLGIK